jgi:hypothetical protein
MDNWVPGEMPIAGTQEHNSMSSRNQYIDTVALTANFDIYLPNWLARYNKAIVGTLFVMNELIVFWLWLK